MGKGLGRKRSWPEGGTVSAFACRDKGKTTMKLSQDSRCPAECHRYGKGSLFFSESVDAGPGTFRRQVGQGDEPSCSFLCNRAISVCQHSRGCLEAS
jgi:hypothetical protein